MAVSGSNLAMQIRCGLIRPVLAFSGCIFNDVLPPFSNLDARAEKIASDYYNHVWAEPAGEYQDIDMADVADDAQNYSLSWYQRW
jgi:hypothetical protein